MGGVAALNLGHFVVCSHQGQGVNFSGMVLERGMKGEEVEDLVTSGIACIVFLQLVQSQCL